jgi:hypothetical protein
VDGIRDGEGRESRKLGHCHWHVHGDDVGQVPVCEESVLLCGKCIEEEEVESRRARVEKGGSLNGDGLTHEQDIENEEILDAYIHAELGDNFTPNRRLKMKRYLTL